MKTIRPPVRVALIGAGGITAEHVKGFKAQADRLRCVAIAEPVEASRRRRMDELGYPCRGFDDWGALLAAMSDEIDAVDICLPHHLHADAILAAAAAGKHVLCEKPMCTSLADADRIGRAIADAGVTYMSAHNQLFLPAVAKAKEMIDAGVLGRLFWLRSQDCFWANWGEGGNPFKGTWRERRETQGGGVLIDTGYHPTYRLLHLAGGRAVAVRGTTGRYRQTIEGEDTASVQVRFDNGAIGEIFTSWAMALPAGTHQVHLIGEEGQLFGSGDTLFHLQQGESTPREMKFDFVNTFTAEIGHFADCLIDGKRPIHGYEEGRAVLEVILAATRDAAESGQL